MTCPLWAVCCVYSKMVIILESFRSKEVICVYECQWVCSRAEFASGIGHLRVSLLWMMHPLCVIHVSFVRNISQNLEIFFSRVESGIPRTDAWPSTTLPRWRVSDLIPHGVPSHVMEPHAYQSYIHERPSGLSLHTIKFIPETDLLFLCWNSQSFHLRTGGVSRFTTQNISWTGSFRTFIVHGPWTGSKTVRILPKIEQNTFCWQPEMEIPSCPHWTGLGPVRKRYRSMSLRNGISLGIRGKTYQNLTYFWLCGES